jgi:hypothetical protein
MTFSELTAEVLRQLDENGSTFWQTPEVQAAINEGYQELSDVTEWYETSDTMTLVANETYQDLRDWDDEILTLRHVWNATTSEWLDFIDVRELDFRAYRRWETNTGEPRHLFMRSPFTVGVYPHETTAGTLTVYYSAMPEELSAASDTPDLPREFHEALIEYALYDLLVQDGLVEAGLDHWKQFVGYQTGLNQWVRKKISRDRMYGGRP